MRTAEITYQCDRCSESTDGGFASMLNDNGWRHIQVEAYTDDREVFVPFLDYDLCRSCYTDLTAFLRMDKPDYVTVG
jgi:hypothetical protein